VNTQPTHTGGPGGVALAKAAAASGVPLVLWDGMFDPTVDAGYAAPAGAIGVSADAGIVWFHPMAGSPTTWINMANVWQLVATGFDNLIALLRICNDLFSLTATLPQSSTLSENSTVWDIPVDAEASGAFVVRAHLLGLGSDPSAYYRLRINGATAQFPLAITSDGYAPAPVVTGTNLLLRPQPAIVLYAGSLHEVVVSCDFPRIAEGAARIVRCTSTNIFPTATTQIVSLAAQYTGADAIASIGFEAVTTGDAAFSAGSHAVLTCRGF